MRARLICSTILALLSILHSLEPMQARAGEKASQPESFPRPGPCAEQTIAEPYPLATSPDRLMANFQRAYNEKNLEEYARTLDEGFVYVFPPEQAYMAPPDGTYDRAHELASAERIFHGKPGLNWAGQEHRIVRDVQLDLKALDAWRRTAPDEYTRVYGLWLVVDYESGEAVTVNRRQEFTVVAQRFEYDVTRATYTLLRWREFGGRPSPRLAVEIPKTRF
jgi:hypothetical protein